MLKFVYVIHLLLQLGSSTFLEVKVTRSYSDKITCLKDANSIADLLTTPQFALTPTEDVISVYTLECEAVSLDKKEP